MLKVLCEVTDFGSVSSTLQQESVPFHTAEDCKKSYVDYHDAFNPELMICAGGKEHSVCNVRLYRSFCVVFENVTMLFGLILNF